MNRHCPGERAPAVLLDKGFRNLDSVTMSEYASWKEPYFDDVVMMHLPLTTFVTETCQLSCVSFTVALNWSFGQHLSLTQTTKSI